VCPTPAIDICVAQENDQTVSMVASGNESKRHDEGLPSSAKIPARCDVGHPIQNGVFFFEPRISYKCSSDVLTDGPRQEGTLSHELLRRPDI
jgi:hypothetical protein